MWYESFGWKFFNDVVKFVFEVFRNFIISFGVLRVSIKYPDIFGVHFYAVYCLGWVLIAISVIHAIVGFFVFVPHGLNHMGALNKKVGRGFAGQVILGVPLLYLMYHLGVAAMNSVYA